MIEVAADYVGIELHSRNVGGDGGTIYGGRGLLGESGEMRSSSAMEVAFLRKVLPEPMKAELELAPGYAEYSRGNA